MLTWLPCVVLDWNRDAREAVFFYLKVGFPGEAVFEDGSHPREAEAWNIYCSCSDEVMPGIDKLVPDFNPTVAGSKILVEQKFDVPGSERVVAVEEEDENKDDCGQVVCHLEELVAKFPILRQSPL